MAKSSKPEKSKDETMQAATHVSSGRVSFSKVQRNSLTFEKSNLACVRLVLGWEADEAVDLDASCFLLSKEGKCDEDNFVFYRSPHEIRAEDADGKPLTKLQTKKELTPSGRIITKTEEVPVVYKTSKCQSVVHYGDALTGKGEDDEQIRVFLNKLPRRGANTDIAEIYFVLTIYMTRERNHTFKNVNKLKVTIWDDTDFGNPSILHEYDIPTEDKKYEDIYSMAVGSLLYSEEQKKWRYESYEVPEMRTLPEYAADFGIEEDK